MFRTKHYDSISPVTPNAGVECTGALKRIEIFYHCFALSLKICKLQLYWQRQSNSMANEHMNGRPTIFIDYERPLPMISRSHHYFALIILESYDIHTYIS